MGRVNTPDPVSANEPKRKPGRPKKPEGRMHQKSIRLPDNQWRMVESIAAAERRSQSWVISECLKILTTNGIIHETE